MVRISRVLIVVAAAGLLLSGCTVKKTERPGLTGPSELALSINLTANPDIVTQDGSSQSRIVILARDANAVPVKGLQLHAELFVNKSVPAAGQLSASDVTTGNDGRATLTYTAPPLPPDSSDQGIIITVSVIPTGTDFANAVQRTVNIRLVPPGVVTNGPVATFSYAPLTVVTDGAVAFDGSSSAASDGATIVSYAWNFGDGTTGTGVKPQHTFRATGNYNVSLTVTDDHGRSSYTCTQKITVTTPQAPTADFVYSPSQPYPRQTVFYNAAGSKPGTGRTLTSYAWNLGDGTTASGVTCSNSYANAGTYNVTLTVTDDVGQTATRSVGVTVGAASLKADFTLSTAAQTVVVDPGISTASQGATIVSYEWVFGDSTTVVSTTSRVQMHTYPNPGVTIDSSGNLKPNTASYAITLTVTDSTGAKASTSKTINILGS